MATVNDPKTADNDYEQYNVASVVFDIGEDTSVGGGFSTLKSRDVTIKIGVRDFGKWNLNWSNGLRIGISVAEPDGTQIFKQSLENIISSDTKYQLTVSLPMLNTEMKYAVNLWAGTNTKTLTHREDIEIPDYQDPTTQRVNPAGTVVYHEGYYPDDEQWERDQPFLPSGFERPVPPT